MLFWIWLNHYFLSCNILWDWLNQETSALRRLCLHSQIQTSDWDPPTLRSLKYVEKLTHSLHKEICCDTQSESSRKSQMKIVLTFQY